ncbi:hypothetical protein Avbf_19112 [Armadillidium vulgare]|nr:hypothetical protein Avbf_19112 [Armadillidium vulgare]
MLYTLNYRNLYKFELLSGTVENSSIREHTEFLKLQCKTVRRNFEVVFDDCLKYLIDDRKIVVDYSPVPEITETWPWMKVENENDMMLGILQEEERSFEDSEKFLSNLFRGGNS